MIKNETFIHDLQAHYAPRQLSERILAALASAGKDLGCLTLEDLAPLDEFHIRGRQATVELAERLHPAPEHEVLDAGSGLGGASRYLAHTYGCRVVGLDLTEEYVEAAKMLAVRTNLSDRVTYQVGSSADMPFDANRFDIVWLQHASMNIADKPRLYREIHRVLKPGGRFAMYDILAGSGGPVLFPVPWAHTAEQSFLSPPETVRGLLDNLGFKNTHWRDMTEPGRAFFEAILAKAKTNGPPPLGFHVFLGPDFRAMAVNTLQNLSENRIAVIEAVYEKM